MALHSLGQVTVPTPGTPVQATINQGSPQTRIPCFAMMFQALPSNVGTVYIGLLGLNRSTFAQVLAILVAPTVTSTPSYSAAAPNVPGAFNLADIYIDAESAQDGVLVTYIAG